MQQVQPFKTAVARRTFLTSSGYGLGSAALASLFHPQRVGAAARTEPERGIVNPLHVEPKIKRVIFLCMAGGPSHLETFDYKPKLAQMHGQGMPQSFTKGKAIAQLQGKELTCSGPQFAFRKCGESGLEISTLFRHIPKIADDLCVIRSMKTEAINHDPAHTFMNTGTTISGRPAMGSWILYGIGSDTEDLPGFVVLTSSGGGGNQPISARQWHSGFLPGQHQGAHFYSSGDPVLYVRNPAGVALQDQREVVQAVQSINNLRRAAVNDSEIATRIRQYELAFRMQISVPELMDISDERQETLEMYGTKGADGTFGGNCLLARRMAERGVRFIQLYHRGWDHHQDLKKGIIETAGHVDQACAALIKDLKQRGLFDDTLVVWGGEFGRTPMAQGTGRDHHMEGFSMWLAGGGVKPGFSYGATDELGYAAAENVVHVHDLHATMLHLLGIDHLKLTYKYQGRDFRLTDVAGHVVTDLLA